MPNATSPPEVQTAMLLGLPQRLGGEGLGGFTHNERIVLGQTARTLSAKDCRYCDPYWDDGLDLECQSTAFHDNDASFLSDADRSAALEAMGIRVLPMTSSRLGSVRSVEALAATARTMRGLPRHAKTQRQHQTSVELLRETQVDWA